jgi:hypothetical protein
VKSRLRTAGSSASAAGLDVLPREQTFRRHKASLLARMSKKNGLADPTRLKPFGSGDKQLLRVVIETPKGSRNKFAFDPDEHIFELKKVLPAGMAFPYDFGFVPSTKADDGDPIDVLVLMDEPAFAGCGHQNNSASGEQIGRP